MASAEADEINAELKAFADSLDTDPPPTLDEMRAGYTTLAEIGTKPSGVTWTEVDVAGIPAIWADAQGGCDRSCGPLCPRWGLCHRRGRLLHELHGSPGEGDRVSRSEPRLSALPRSILILPRSKTLSKAFQWLRNARGSRPTTSLLPATPRAGA